MSRLILHVGTHKTATTTIQRHLAANRSELEARGIWYPGYDLIGERNHYAHLGMANALTGNHDRFSQKAAERFFSAVARRSRDYDVTLLSAEPFYRHIAYVESGRIPRDPDRYWPLRHAYIERVRALFGELPVEVAIVFRQQAAYAQSLYQEHVKVTRYSRPFRRFLKDFWFHFEYADQARAWARVFDDLSVLPFDDIVRGGTPVLNFGRALGTDLQGRTDIPAANTSLHTDMVILKRMMHTSSLGRKEIRETVEKAAEGPLHQRLSALRHRSFFDDSSHIANFQERYSDTNETLRSEFRSDLAAPLFPEVSSDDLLFGDRLHPYAIDHLLKEILSPSPPP